MPGTTGVLQRVALASCLCAVTAAGQAATRAFGDAGTWHMTVRVDSAAALTDSARLVRVQDQLIRTAESSYRGARVVSSLPGFADAVRDVERLTRLTWTGLPPVIMLVPDRGHGFSCEERGDGCLGQYIGAEVSVPGEAGRVASMSSIILIAESARRRGDVWVHELTHALLTQHGMFAESQRHDRRFFSEESFVLLDAR
jgi:hypothetical protein